MPHPINHSLTRQRKRLSLILRELADLIYPPHSNANATRRALSVQPYTNTYQQRKIFCTMLRLAEEILQPHNVP